MQAWPAVSMRSFLGGDVRRDRDVIYLELLLFCDVITK